MNQGTVYFMFSPLHVRCTIAFISWLGTPLMVMMTSTRFSTDKVASVQTPENTVSTVTVQQSSGSSDLLENTPFALLC